MNDQDYSTWIAEENGRMVRYIAGQVAVDKLADEQERIFRIKHFDARKQEFVARSIFNFVMQEDQ